MEEWKGVIPAMVTPLKDEGKSLDVDALKEYCAFLADRKVDGVFCGGTTGEGPLLSMDERRKLAEVTVSQLEGKVSVIVQTGCIRTDQTLELTKHACDIGAKAVGVVLPYYYTYGDDMLYAYFSEIAESVPDFPLFLYNIPGCTTNDVSLELFKRLLGGIKSIVGIKNSTDDIFQTSAFIHTAGKRCAIFNGNDGLLLPALSIGAAGLVSGNASAFPEPFVELFHAFEDGDLVKARDLQRFIDKLRMILASGRDNASFKRALQFRGIPAGGVRKPDRDLTDEESARLRDSLKGLDLL
jgi:dihydrodipicolinate synthase/N-acetylneuraminate lyase